MSDFGATFRGRYRPSGRVDLPRFAAFGLGALSVAAGCAWFLWLGFESRFYTPLLFILGCAMIVAGLSLLAVRLGHCRSPVAALLLGFAGGFILQPGHHLLPYLADLESGAALDPADFVRHLDRRLSEVEMKWDTSPHIRDREPDEEPSRGNYLFLWGSTIFEMIFIPLACGLPSLLRVLRNPYCEAGGQWAERTRLAFIPGSEDALRDALAAGRLAEVAGQLIIEHHPNRPALVGLLDVCAVPAHDGTAGFFSLKSSRGDAAAALEVEALAPYYRLRLRCAALSATEVEQLRALTPERATARVAPSWLEVVDDEPPAGDLARLELVEQAQPPPAADRRGRRIAELLNFAPLLGGAAAGLGLWLVAGQFEDTAQELTHAFILSGFAAMLAGLWLMLMDQHFLGDRFLLRRLRERLDQRPSPRVRPEDPDVLPVALVPRGAWSGGASELVDHGLLAVRDAVFYEGDRQRMEIPAASIQTIYGDSLTIDQYQTWHFAVLEVRAADGLHTLPFVRICAPLGETLFRSKKRRARVLFDRLVSFVEERMDRAAEASI